MTTTTQPSIGQRLREWRLAKSWSIADVAAELDLRCSTVIDIEAGGNVGPLIHHAIESLIATPNPNHDHIVDAAVAAIRAGLEQGCRWCRSSGRRPLYAAGWW